MVSQTTRYALIILGHLANRPRSWCPVAEISRETRVPANYLSKILNRLAKYRIVDALKGWGGGYRLRQDSLERPIRDVLYILEGHDAGGMQECVFGLPRCDDAAPCPLHHHWKAIRESYDRMLGETRIGELCGRENGRPKTRSRPGRPKPSSPARSRPSRGQ